MCLSSRGRVSAAESRSILRERQHASVQISVYLSFNTSNQLPLKTYSPPSTHGAMLKVGQTRVQGRRSTEIPTHDNRVTMRFGGEQALPRMSAFGGKADSGAQASERLLIARRRHPHQLRINFFAEVMDLLSHQFLKSPQISVVNAKLFQFRDCVVQIACAGTNMPTGSRKNPCNTL